MAEILRMEGARPFRKDRGAESLPAHGVGNAVSLWIVSTQRRCVLKIISRRVIFARALYEMV